MVIPVLITLPGAALMGKGSRQSNLQGREERKVSRCLVRGWIPEKLKRIMTLRGKAR